MVQKNCFLCLLVLILCTFLTTSLDLWHTEIVTVTDETRYKTQHPNIILNAFKKVRHVKGNYVFTSGERIDGDRLLLNFLDKTQNTKAADVEVQLKYPANGLNGATLTSVEIYADLSSDLADVFFCDGGINKKYAEMLLECNKTLHYTYEIFMYGY